MSQTALNINTRHSFGQDYLYNGGAKKSFGLISPIRKSKQRRGPITPLRRDVENHRHKEKSVTARQPRKHIIEQRVYTLQEKQAALASLLQRRAELQARICEDSVLSQIETARLRQHLPHKVTFRGSSTSLSGNLLHLNACAHDMQVHGKAQLASKSAARGHTLRAHPPRDSAPSVLQRQRAARFIRHSQHGKEPGPVHSCEVDEKEAASAEPRHARYSFQRNSSTHGAMKCEKCATKAVW